MQRSTQQTTFCVRFQDTVITSRNAGTRMMTQHAPLPTVPFPSSAPSATATYKLPTVSCQMSITSNQLAPPALSKPIPSSHPNIPMLMVVQSSSCSPKFRMGFGTSKNYIVPSWQMTVCPWLSGSQICRLRDHREIFFLLFHSFTGFSSSFLRLTTLLWAD